MKQSASVVWLIHSLEVLVLSAVFSLVLTLYQAFQSGNLTMQAAGVAAGSLAVSLLGNGLRGIVSNANFAQALEDVFNEMAHRQQAASPVTINNHIPPATPAPVQATTLKGTFDTTTNAPLPAQFVQPFPYQASSTYPQVPAVQVPQ